MPTPANPAPRAEPPVDHRPPSAAAWRAAAAPKGYPAAFGTGAGAAVVGFDLASL